MYKQVNAGVTIESIKTLGVLVKRQKIQFFSLY